MDALAHLEVLRDLTDETLEGQLADEELSRLLVATDLAKGDRSGTEAMGLLYTTSGSLQDKLRFKSMPDSDRVANAQRQRSYGLQTWRRAAYEVLCLWHDEVMRREWEAGE